MPSLVKLYNEFQNKDLIVLAIDVQEKREIVKKYAEKKNLPFPVLLDTDGKVAYDYGIRSHPAHFLIDREGKLIGVAMGARDWASVESRNLIGFLVDRNKHG
jgi:peroxiredoxin